MKKRLLITLLTMLMVAASAIGLASCNFGGDGDTHKHAYATEWSYDETYHWHAATCEHKDLVSGKEKHTFLGDICSVCGYERENVDVPLDEYSVIFDANNGSFDSGNLIEITVEKDSKISEPQEEPFRTGYTFIGWSLSSDGNELWDFESGLVSDNITLYAVWLQNVSVVFDANGGKFENGESTYSIELTMGDMITAPESPEYDGYTFSGWYIDGKLLETWDFENDTVTENTTLYAGWIANIEEHDVTFVLNYAGAKNVVQSTENGLVTFVPEREGYVFNGWWYSDGKTDDGYILSQKFDTTEIVTEDNLFLYAEWVEEATVSIQLPAPSVSIDQDEFIWNAINGANGYRIIVTRSGSSEELLNTTIRSTSWTFPSNYDAGYYTVRIRANGDGTNAVNSSYVSKSYAHKTLGTISEISFDLSSSVLTWTSVKNATSYELYINNKLIDTLTYTSYDMSGYDAGTYSISIVAQRDGYVSSTTRSTIEKLRLRTPENINYYIDSETKAYILTWDSVLYADTYILTIGEREVRIEDTTYTISASADMWDENQQLVFTVKAFDSNADYLVSNPAEEIELVKVYSVTVEIDNTTAGNTSIEGSLFALPEFTVSFNLNGALGSISAQSVTTTKGLTYPQIPTRNGYVFTGWYTDSNCTQLYDFSATLTRDLTLYAGWYEITTTGYGNYVTTNPASSYSIPSSGTSSSSQRYVYFSILSDGEYTLYYRNSSSSSSYGTRIAIYNVTDGSSILGFKNCYSTSNANVTFNAKAGDVIRVSAYRNNISYSATLYFYISNYELPTAGGLATSYYVESESTNEMLAFAEYGSTVKLIATDKDENYFFIGWYNGEELVSNEKTISFKVEKDVVYTVKYGCYTLTVDKNINGGTVSDYSGTPIKEGKQITITANTLAGYTFIGWYNGEVLLTSELNYTFTMPEENITYTAKWVKVEAESNNTSAGTVTALNGRYKVGDVVTVTATTKTGYTFVGWFDGEELLSSELSYTFAMPAVDTTFTAKWIKVTLSRNNTSGGTISSLSGKYIVGEEVTVTASTMDGYTFVGWYEGDKFLTNELSYSFKMPSTEMTLIAQWIECPVTLERSITSAGYVSGLSGPTRVGEEVTITAETYSGYTWIGWYDGETELTKELSYTFVMSDTEKTFTAKWKANQYEIVLDANGGKLESESTLIVNFGETKDITVPIKTDYYFGGWYTKEGTQITDNEGIMLSGWNVAEDVTLVAEWLRSITFDSNGGNSIATIYVMPGESIKLPSAQKTGYTLDAWQYNGSNCGTSYTMPDKNITLEAKWKANTYRIYYNGTSISVTYGESYSIPTPTKTGYTFKNFTLSDGRYFSSSGTYTYAYNTQLTCNWRAELSRTVSAGCTINENVAYLERGMTFTITYSGKSMKNFHIETNIPVNITFTGPGWTYNNVKSKGINSQSGSTKMVMTITIVDLPAAGRFTLKFTCGTSIVTGPGY